MATSRPPLKVTPFDAKTLSWWRARADKIDMSPPYQRRGRLWSNTDKAYLIDSIINGFDVPKLYVADFTYADSALNKRQLPYAIIDGKQRFEAIFDFFSGRVTLNHDFVFLENPSLPLGGLGYRDITQNYPQVAEIFDNFNLTVMSVITDKEELINELFVRLNRSKPLTGAEVRNAMAGPAPEVIRQVAKHEFFEELIAFPVQRGQDLNAAAKFLAFEFYEKPQETKKTSLDSFVKSASSNRDKLELSARRAYANLDVLSGIFLPRDKLLASAGVLPVYYWFVRGLEVAQHSLVRDFLVRFELDRKENRLRAEDGLTGPGVDARLLEYDGYNRSTNDLTSHNGRIAILREKFGEFARRARR